MRLTAIKAVALAATLTGSMIGTPARPADDYKQGEKLLEKGDFRGAITALDKAIRLRPTDARAYDYRGQALGALGKTKQALDDFNQAIKLNPRYLEANYDCGSTWLVMGDNEKAIKFCTTAIEINPKCESLHHSRRCIYRVA